MLRYYVKGWTILALASRLLAAAPPAVPLTNDLQLTESAVVRPGTYTIPDPENDGAVRIIGNGITVDFAGAVLRGATESTPADAFAGRGLVVRGENIVVKNLHVHGYKIGIFGEAAPGLRLESSDVSRNFRQRLKSTLAREDLADWLYGHENDDNQWLRYGAGIYLLNCPDATVRNCRARNGQNGLCLVRSDGVHVVDNDFSFMSGWGLAMWRSSRCDVFNNKFDWCIRGYSHGVYSRGQDSAGILVYEQCHDNVFAYNSATHGGDGFFLYAGNETLRESGTGGCNRNLVYRNNFSHAAANGIEATFSHDNRFIENRLDECTHGVWAGYSFDTLIADNTMRQSRNGVSIEHGRRNRIGGNTIADAEVGVHLWWDDDTDLLASAFGKLHEGCPSAHNLIRANTFTNVQTAVRLHGDSATRMYGNTFIDVAVPLAALGSTRKARVELPQQLRDKARRDATAEVQFRESASDETADTRLSPTDMRRIQAKRGKQSALLAEGALRGRKYIFVDNWGPYDFSTARLWPMQSTRTGRAGLQVLAPQPTEYRVTSLAGAVEVTPPAGEAPQRIEVACVQNGVHDYSVEITVGDAPLRATGVLLCASWRVALYSWAQSEEPRTAESWKQILCRAPLHEMETSELSFAWGYRAPAPGVPADRFATTAEADIDLPAGRWRMATISDDGVRVFIDGRQVLSNWTHHGPTRDETTAELEAGRHAIRIEHFEIDGFAQLAFELARAP